MSNIKLVPSGTMPLLHKPLTSVFTPLPQRLSKKHTSAPGLPLPHTIHGRNSKQSSLRCSGAGASPRYAPARQPAVFGSRPSTKNQKQRFAAQIKTQATGSAAAPTDDGPNFTSIVETVAATAVVVAVALCIAHYAEVAEGMGWAFSKLGEIIPVARDAFIDLEVRRFPGRVIGLDTDICRPSRIGGRNEFSSDKMA
eukprot:9162543-Pyramimonas_sp.AAC.1